MTDPRLTALLAAVQPFAALADKLGALPDEYKVHSFHGGTFLFTMREARDLAAAVKIWTP